MTMWDRIKYVLKREAADVKEGMSNVGRTLNEELARKERELSATPSERFDMILEDIEESDSRLSELESQIRPSPGAPDLAQPEPRQRREPTHQLLDAPDVSDPPGLDQALGSVNVEFQPIDSVAHTHIVSIGDAADISVVADVIGEHPLVAFAAVAGPETIHVRADGLHVEDVRLLAAAAVAEQRSS